MVKTRHLRKRDCTQLPENPLSAAQSECCLTGRTPSARLEFLTCLGYAVAWNIRDWTFFAADHCNKCQAEIAALDRILISDGRPVERRVHQFGSDQSLDGDIRARNPLPACFLPHVIEVYPVSYAERRRKLTRIYQYKKSRSFPG